MGGVTLGISPFGEGARRAIEGFVRAWDSQIWEVLLGGREGFVLAVWGGSGADWGALLREGHVRSREMLVQCVVAYWDVWSGWCSGASRCFW